MKEYHKGVLLLSIAVFIFLITDYYDVNSFGGLINKLIGN